MFGCCSAQCNMKDSIYKPKKVSPMHDEEINIGVKQQKLGKRRSSIMNALRIAWPTMSWIKLVRAGVFICCVGGFIAQSYTFLALYLKYPTVVDVQVKRPEEMELPAITFCKRIHGSEENHPFPLILETEGISSEENSDIVNASWNSLLASCETYSKGETSNCRLGSISMMHVPDEAGRIVDCYTVFSKINTSDTYPLQIPKRKQVLLQMILNLAQLGTNSTIISEGQVAVHSPYVLVNPYSDGFVLQASYLYIIQISMQEKVLLESPYDTNCTDYQNAWLEKESHGPLSHQMCMEECILNITLLKYNCTPMEILYPHQKKSVCSKSIRELNEETFSVCHSSCSEACRFKTYEYEIQKRKLNSRIFHHVSPTSDSHQNSWNETSVLQMYLKRPEILTFTHRPQFQFVETFSYIGGLLGIWLGISLIAVLDFIQGSYKMATRIHQRFGEKKKKTQANNEAPS